MVAGLAIGITAWLAFAPTSPVPATAPVARPAESPPVRPTAVIAPLACDGAIELGLPSVGVEPASVAWSPDGTQLAVGTRQFARFGPRVLTPRIALLIPATLEVRELAPGADPLWSADGKRLVFRERAISNDPTSDLVVFDVASSREVARIAGANGALSYAWRGSEIVFWRGSALFSWNAGRETRLFDGPPAWAQESTVTMVRFSGDGERAVVTVGPGWDRRPADVVVLDTRAGSAERLIGAWRAEPSPRGHIVFASYLDRRELWLEDGRTVSTMRPFTGGFLMWSADGREPLLSPNDFVGSGWAVDLEAFDGSQVSWTLPVAPNFAALNSRGDAFAGIEAGGRGPARLALKRCRAVDPRTGPATLTVYYGESNTEPWAARRDGTAPPDWEAHARRDLEQIGLHPLEIGRVRTLNPENTCDQPSCPNGFGLRVLIPYAERTRAYSRCFREPSPSTLAMDAAIRAFRCVPLYTYTAN
jgi:dipeptidyl aminopeptidase/acylaminoacyl peptidase